MVVALYPAYINKPCIECKNMEALLVALMKT